MINYNNVIENKFEKKLYFKLHNDVINYLNNFGKTDFWKIVKNVGGSERRMIRLLNEMVINGEIKYSHNEFFIPGSLSNVDCICDTCKGKRVVFEKIDYIVEKLKEIWLNKPEPTFIFDQRPVNMKTTLNRVAYLLSNNDIYEKKILLLGDDDLTSIAIALLNINCEVVAFDIDERLIDYINEVSQEYNLNLKGIKYNALDEVDKEYLHYFDVVMTDPTPEKKPFNVFMNRAIDFTKNDSIIYTSIYSSAMLKNIELQKIITKMNLYITDIIPTFTEYQSIYELYNINDINLFEKYNISYSESSICFTESLVRMKKSIITKKIPIKFRGNDLFGKATKRVIKDEKADVKVKIEDDEYLRKIKNEMINNENRELISK